MKGGMMHPKFPAPLFICWLLLSGPAAAEFKPIENVTLEQMLGGEKIRRILNESQGVEVFRLGIKPSSPPPVKFPASDAAGTVAALNNVGNFGSRYLCDFSPGAKFRFGTKEGILDIVICFDCGEMQLYLDEKIVKRDIPWVGSINSFSPAARRAFVQLTQKAFPLDVKIRELKE
jgi:hypothetical protein